MNKRAILTICIMAVVAVAVIGSAWYLSLGRTVPLELTPAGSFPVVEVDNNRTINLTFEKLEGSGSANYEDCRLAIIDPQGIQYNWNLTGIIWTNNEAKNDSVLPGIDLRVIRSTGQMSFNTGNLIELVKHSGKLAEGNWAINLIFKPTGGTIASKTITV